MLLLQKERMNMVSEMNKKMMMIIIMMMDMKKMKMIISAFIRTKFAFGDEKEWRQQQYASG